MEHDAESFSISNESSEQSARCFLRVAVSAALERQTTPADVTVAWSEINNSFPIADTLLQSLEGRIGTLEKSHIDAVICIEADLNLLLSWAAICSNWLLFQRIKILVKALELKETFVSDSLQSSPAWLNMTHTVHDSFELIKLSYLAQPEFTPSAYSNSEMVDCIRWHVAQLMSEQGGQGGCVAMQHIRVAQVGADAAKAFVCVHFQIVRSSGYTGLDTPLPDADAMSNGNELPPGWEWQPSSAAILFASVWTDRNVDFMKAPLVLCDDGIAGCAHGGFLFMLQDLWPQVIAALSDASGLRPGGGTDYLGDSTVWLLGHSMGAALATLAAPRILALIADPAHRPRVRLQTTGSPRVLDARAALAFRGLPRLTAERFFLPGDAIHHLPPAWSLDAGRIQPSLVTLGDSDAFLADQIGRLSALRWKAPPRLPLQLQELDGADNDLCGFQHVGEPHSRVLPREEVGWVAPWHAWAAGGFSQLQFRRLHDSTCYRRSEDRAPRTPLLYPWYVQLALGAAGLWAARRASKGLRRRVALFRG